MYEQRTIYRERLRADLDITLKKNDRKIEAIFWRFAKDSVLLQTSTPDGCKQPHATAYIPECRVAV